MKATASLLELLQDGVQLWTEDDELCYQAPQGALTPARREELSELKAEIVALLTQQKTKYSFPSFAQQRLWFLDQREPGSPFYNMPAAIRLTGQLNVAALDQSLNEIVRRHQTLRTTFPAIEGQPLQVIAPAQPLTLPMVDLQGLRESEREASVRWLAREEARRPFDLAQGPLFRTKLLQLGEEEHVLLLTMHHIISDGWSMGVFWRELRALYDAFSSGKPSPLADLPIQYADYAVWQRQWLQGEELDKQLGYWKRQLADVPALELPTDRPRPPIQTHRGARRSLTLSKSLTEALRALSRREGVTLFMALLAAFQVLLSRYSGQDDITVGSPIAGRNRAETEGLIGFFVNTLVLRTDLSGDPTFRELLGRVQEVALGAYAHQDLPFEKLVEELHPQRDTSRSPLFQVAFVLQNTPRSPRRARGLPGLKLAPQVVGSGTAKFDLTLSFVEGPAGLKGWAEYNTDLFDPSTIDRMLGHFRTLLKGVVASPAQRLSELPLLTEVERHQLLIEWNNTARDYPRDRCIHELFEEQAERNPEAVAVVFEDQHLTYRELNWRANRLAHTLRELGVGPEMPVGVCLERSPEMVVGLLGVLKAGGAYVPLDPTHPPARLEFALEDTTASVLLIQEATRSAVPGRAIHTLCLDADSARIERADAENPRSSGATAENLAYVIYTSGSTGKPKGVCVPHRAVGRLVMKADYAPLTSADVVAQVSNCAFDAATWEIWGALLNGARLVVLPRDVTLSPPALAAEIEQHEISALFLTTALFNQVARENPAAFRPLRHLLFGGEAVEPKWVRTVLAKGAPERLLHVYGPTETTTFATWHLVEAVEAGAATIPIGHPIANTEAYVLDARQRPVPIGVPGELYIGGPGVACGYLNCPELTEEKFISHPFSDEPGARLYKTGDRVRRWVNGDIEFLGRSDGQVKLRGYRIELGEVESVLSSHPVVRESVVMLREDDIGEKRLVAYIVAAGVSPSHNELRAFLRERLPDYMVPSSFISLKALPLTSNGKIDRHALPPVPIATRPADSESHSDAPRDALEKRLAGMWEEALGVPAVGMEDDFFELGGHSLLAARLFGQIEKVFGRRLPLSTLFRAPTVRQLADVLRRESEEVPRESIVPIQTNGSRPPFFCVPSSNPFGFLALAQHLGPDQPFYSFQAQDQNKEQTASLKIEDRAASYVREMRKVQPEGPYFLGGYCFGGVVAFEMAQQLRLQGQDVALVAILEKALPNSKRSIQGRLYLYKRRMRRLSRRGYWRLRKKIRKCKRRIRKCKRRVRRSAYRNARKARRRVREVRYIIGTLRRAVYKSPLRFGYHLRHAIGDIYPRDQGQRWDADSKEQTTWKQLRRAVYKSPLRFGYHLRHAIGDIYPRDQGQRWDADSKEQTTWKQKRRAAKAKAHDSWKLFWKLELQALNSYKAQPYAGRITVFPSARRKSYWMFHNGPCLGWDRVAAGGVEVHEVPGRHTMILKDPHVQVLAARLKTCLEQARAGSS